MAEPVDVEEVMSCCCTDMWMYYQNIPIAISIYIRSRPSIDVVLSCNEWGIMKENKMRQKVPTQEWDRTNNTKKKKENKSHMQTLRRKRKRTSRQIRRPRTQRFSEQLLARVGVAGRPRYRAHRCEPTAAVVDVLLDLD